jgi:hypothetical protein
VVTRVLDDVDHNRRAEQPLNRQSHAKQVHIARYPLCRRQLLLPHAGFPSAATAPPQSIKQAPVLLRTQKVATATCHTLAHRTRQRQHRHRIPYSAGDSSMLFSFEERRSDSCYVERIWRTHSTRTGAFISQATAHWEMVVARQGRKTLLTVRGPETKATPAVSSVVDAEWMGIVFTLGTFMPQLPPCRVLDRRDVDLPAATRNAIWLEGAAWEVPTYDTADVFVAALVRHGLLVHDPLVDAVLQDRPHELCLRSVQYRFLRATGVTHKVLQQIQRARQAAALLARGVSIGDAVHEAGYVDQSHLTRSLQRFMGQTPTQLARASISAVL